MRIVGASIVSKVRHMVLSMMLVAIVIAQIGFAQRFDARKLFERCASAVVLVETERGRGAGFLFIRNTL